MKSLLVYCFLALFLLAHSCSAQEKPTVLPYPSRSAFAAQMAKVKRGMTEEQVTALLSKPDDVIEHVVTEYSSDSESWLYGITTKFHFASLGKVYFDKDKKVIRTDGGTGKPPPERLISETTLRNLIDFLVGLEPKYIVSGDDYDPLIDIKAVNALQPYGKDRVLAVVNEYYRVSSSMSNNEHVLILLRILFDPPNEYSSFWLDKYAYLPADKTRVPRLPRYPLVLVDDVPIYLPYAFGGSGYGGLSDDSSSRRFLAYLKKHGRIRKTPLRPSSNILAVFDKLVGSDQWLFGKLYRTSSGKLREIPGEEEVPGLAKDLKIDEQLVRQKLLRYEERMGKRMVMLQLLRLVGSVLPESSPYLSDIQNHLPIPDFRDETDRADWPTIRAELSKLSIHWNATLNEYQLNR